MEVSSGCSERVRGRQRSVRWRSAYWDVNPDGTTNIFPGGTPNNKTPHDHIVINDAGGVEYMRENGEVVNDYRQYRG